MTIDAESAVSQLQQLLEQQTLLTHEQAEANRLERERLTQEQRKLDLEAQRLDFDRQRDNRAAGRYNELMNRLALAVEENTNLVKQLVTMDDRFGETVEQITDTQDSILRALSAILSRNKTELNESAKIIDARLELRKRQKNLGRNQERAAGFGSLNVPTYLANEIEADEQRIRELEEEL